MIFDTHAHYDSGAFNADRFETLEAAHAAGVGLILDPGCDARSSRMALDLAEKYSFVYAAVGIHPEDMDKYDLEAYAEICEMARHPKCVAIGEVGLDYYWDASQKEEQKALFRQQIELAIELGIPVIVHDREAHQDSLDIVKDYPEATGVFHCYSGSAEMAAQLVKRGWMFSFGGSITFKNNKKAPEVIASLPADRIMLETDCPYLAPVPFRGKRNDSSLLPFVCQALARFRGISPEEIEAMTWENGRRFFGV